jgi:GNAT superfamily N-acetyltransferase
MTNIRLATTANDIAACFPVMSELRPHLDRDAFPARVQAMIKEGFELASLEHDGHIVAVAGFRIFDNLCNGRTLYVDDLVTAAAARSQGHGAALLHWLKELAVSRNCNHFSLDSGTHRNAAHRFYLREGFDITDFHFAQSL